jgi:hypothetical protein
VLDRFHLTEYVMSNYFGRRPSGELHASTCQIERALQALTYTGIVLDAPDEVLAERVELRADGRGFELPPNRSRLLWDIVMPLTKLGKIQLDGLDQVNEVARLLVAEASA